VLAAAPMISAIMLQAKTVRDNISVREVMGLPRRVGRPERAVALMEIRLQQEKPHTR